MNPIHIGPDRPPRRPRRPPPAPGSRRARLWLAGLALLAALAFCELGALLDRWFLGAPVATRPPGPLISAPAPVLPAAVAPLASPTPWRGSVYYLVPTPAP